MPLSPLKPVDRIGGADNTTQTIAHCGYLPMSASLYTSTPLNVRIIQSKLSKLGFYRGPTNGRYDSASRAAVRAFQADYGMPADGVVGPTTAQRIAYASHPLANVRRCGYVVASGR